MNGSALGPLHGVPTAIKDLFDFKPGWPFTFGGVRAMKDCVAHWHWPILRTYRKSGVPLFSARPTARHGSPWSHGQLPVRSRRAIPSTRERTPADRQGGSAAAVADGLVPFAEGTDAGGSIRIPACVVQCRGLPALTGRVPVVMRPNAFGGTLPFVYEGPISRTWRSGTGAFGVGRLRLARSLQYRDQ